MGIFHKKKNTAGVNSDFSTSQAVLAEMVLNSINDGVMIIDQTGLIKLINPAATRMTGNTSAEDLIKVPYLTVLKLESAEGMPIPDAQNPLAIAVAKNESWESRNYCLVTAQNKKIPVAISMVPTGENSANRIITFRDIAQELEKEGEQTEFISTASHEMRTPVASIEGYLGLALNPQTATIDDRARQYLNEAHDASQHLGKLFRDLLDVTKLDDKRAKLHLEPVDMVVTVKDIADRQFEALNNKRLKYTFGTEEDDGGKLQLNQAVYAMVDIDFLQEILNNLIENAIKYTDDGGAIWVNVRGDGDEVLINVTDTGMGIAPDSLAHIFQKFYRIDNSQTRTIGGTGLGLYIVKERVEAMGGRVWAESAFGEGSTFYVSLPRITEEEYERQKMVARNTQMMAPQGPPPSGMGASALVAADPFKDTGVAPFTPIVAPNTETAPATSGANAPAPAQNTPVAAPAATTPTTPAPFAPESVTSAAPAALSPVSTIPAEAPVAPTSATLGAAPSTPTVGTPITSQIPAPTTVPQMGAQPIATPTMTAATAMQPAPFAPAQPAPALAPAESPFPPPTPTPVHQATTPTSAPAADIAGDLAPDRLAAIKKQFAAQMAKAKAQGPPKTV